MLTKTRTPADRTHVSRVGLIVAEVLSSRVDDERRIFFALREVVRSLLPERGALRLPASTELVDKGEWVLCCAAAWDPPRTTLSGTMRSVEGSMRLPCCLAELHVGLLFGRPRAAAAQESSVLRLALSASS